MIRNAMPTYGGGTDSDSRAFFKIATMLLGLAVGVLGVLAVVMWADERGEPASASPAAAHEHSATVGMTSYAGATPENADALAAAHKAFPAELPAVLPGPVADVNLVLEDITVEIAPGIKYAAWAWAGGAPGPVIHVRQGQMVKITLTNNGAIPHSIDFHAARIAPDKAFTDVAPGKSVSYTFRASDPGVFMYHCGTKPCSPTSRTGCTARSSSSRRRASCPRPTRTTSSSPASGT